MITTTQEQDALAEVVNIGFGRAAAALSELTGYRVIIDLPKVELHPLDEVERALGRRGGDEIATIHQVFHGPVAGDALLVLGREDAGVLARLLAGADEAPQNLSHADRDILTEIGNMVLGACLSAFGNLLSVQVRFAVPCLRLESLSTLLYSLTVQDQELRYGLVIITSFQVREVDVRGHLVIVLAVSSLRRLLEEVERLV